MGLCQSGAADAYSYHWANALLGNLKSAPVLEICLGAFEAEFCHATEIALCGADMRAQLNGSPIKNWCSHRVKAGDYLRLNYPASGLRSYLAVLGGFLFNAALFSSIASVPREGLGFNGGAPISAGMCLPYAALGANKNRWRRCLIDALIPNYAADLQLDIYPAYQWQAFDDVQRQRFTHTTYTVSTESDRMGYRLDGQAVSYRGKQLISEGIALGAVQIPANGQPIVLLNDRQTIGGYPKIGCVTKASCSQLAQRRPGDKVFFNWRHFET